MKKNLSISLLAALCVVLNLYVATATQSDGPYRIAILPFKINAAEDLTYLQEGIMDMLSSRIAWGNKVLMVEKDACRKAYQKYKGNITETAVREIGRELGADYIISGSITIFGENASLDAKIVDLKMERPPITAYTQSRGIDGIIPKINEFATSINEKMFERAETQELAYGTGTPQTSQESTPQASISEMNPELMIPKEELDPEFSIIAREKTKRTLEGFIETTQSGRGNFWKSRNFPFRIGGLDIGDVDKDGKKEIVFISDEGDIWIYRYHKGTIVLVQEIKGKSYNNLISVDVADINKNGIDEIFVSNFNINKGVPSSFVLEWNGKSFDPIANDLKCYLRVIKRWNHEPILVGQKKGIKEPFMAGVYQLRWVGDSYKEGEVITSTPSVSIYGFTYGDVTGDGVDDFIQLGNDDRLRVIAKGGVVEWKSDDDFGGSLDYVPGEVTGEEADPWSQVTEEQRSYLSPRLLLCDLDLDESPEVIAVKNLSRISRMTKRYRHYGSGEICSLSWDGLGLSENWKTKKIHGYLSDLAIADMDNDGENELVVPVVTRIGSSYVYKSRSCIISYDLRLEQTKPEGEAVTEKTD